MVGESQSTQRKPSHNDPSNELELFLLQLNMLFT